MKNDFLEDKNKIKEIMKRKEEHIQIALAKDIQSKNTTLFECIKLFNSATPEINFDEVDTETSFLGHRFSAPVIVGAMTGGAEIAKRINKNIAIAVEELGLGMVVGSQRAALYSKGLEDTFTVARKYAPNAFIGANIGAPQLSKNGIGANDVKKLIKMLDADSLYIHLNPLQELVQPEGEPNFKGVLSKIKEISNFVNVPVIAKEVGFGIDEIAAKKLENSGVKAIEVAGTGGTSYAAIESYRARIKKDEARANIGNLFENWGIPTAASLFVTKNNVKIPIIASGGIRNGLELAKAITVGASMSAVAFPVLKHAMRSSEAVSDYLKNLIYELKAAMFLTGSRSVIELSKKRYVITGELKDWIRE